MTGTVRRDSWEDFVVGEHFSSGGRTVTETDILSFAGLSGDFYPLHVDEEFARDSSFGGRIAHGVLTLALAVGQVVLTGVYGSGIDALAGIDRVRAIAPVRIGDTLRTEVEVLDKRETRRPDRGLVTLGYSVCNQRQEQVMTFELRLVFRRSAACD